MVHVLLSSLMCLPDSPQQPILRNSFFGCNSKRSISGWCVAPTTEGKHVTVVFPPTSHPPGNFLSGRVSFLRPAGSRRDRNEGKKADRTRVSGWTVHML